MGEITLVRHGQANSAARTEEDYDRLSPLGWQQARWLGEWFRAQGEAFDLVLSGSLRRHAETEEALGEIAAARRCDPRLNEMDYFNLGQALQDRHGVPMPEPDGFADHLPRVMEAWHRAEIQGQESFAEFEQRVTGIFQEALQPGRRVLCVTSGGVIGMMLRGLLGLDARRLAHVLLPIRNTSVHRVTITPAGPILAGFNATPHLDPPERAAARTHF